MEIHVNICTSQSNKSFFFKKRDHWVALCGELSLEEAIDLS